MEPFEIQHQVDSGDGRVARGLRTRGLILDAFEGLISDGQIPTTSGLATRASVSPRSIFAHFNDLDGVCVGATGRLLARINLVRRNISPRASRTERLALFCPERAHTLELLRPLLALPSTQRQPSERNRRGLAEVHTTLRAEACAVFAAELEQGSPVERFRLGEAAVAASAWPLWHGLRAEQALTPAEAESVMTHLLSALLGAS
jgi:TetR/AcrR family transcriptional regulator of autoinduction and epiphytic fitness